MKRSLTRAASIALGAAALNAAVRPLAAQTLVALRVGASNDEDYAEGFYAHDLGYFQQGGFDAQITTLTNGGAVIAALIGGALDVGIGNLASISAAHARGLPLVVIAPCALYSDTSLTQAVLVAPDSPIRSAKDLSGKKLALTTLGSLLQVGIKRWIDANGGDSSSAQYLEIPLAEMLVAVDDGRVDAVGMTEPWITQARSRTRLLAAPFASVAKEFLITAWIANRHWLDANPGAGEKFAAVIRRTARWVNANPTPSAVILAKYLHVPVEVVEHMNRTRMANVLEPGLIQPVIDAAARYQLLAHPFPAADLLGSV